MHEEDIKVATASGITWWPALMHEGTTVRYHQLMTTVSVDNTTATGAFPELINNLLPFEAPVLQGRCSFLGSPDTCKVLHLINLLVREEPARATAAQALAARKAFVAAMFDVHGPLGLIKRLTDFLSMGYDVLWFEPDRVWFKHPVAAIYEAAAALGADMLLPASSCSPPDLSRGARLDDRPQHLDLLFIRSTPGTVRCMFQWLWHLSSPPVQPHDHFLNAQHFAPVLSECLSFAKIRYLPTSAFPPFCAARCGCKDGQPQGEPGLTSVLSGIGGVNGTATCSCTKEQLSNMVSVSFPCLREGRPQHMAAYTGQYKVLVREIGSEKYKKTFVEPYAEHDFGKSAGGR
ncbi:hypothetical protein HYH03_003576 [Edaphochlamys debaryana]|uniref:Nucleotide-diphospho-sugar transferase domain-containing protein n=1 Tax=Edaphochlamys debaryana TaxID=47281 RepID=A0A835Y8P5_9CHLO|nr:hypothetical protein HYH03_003576 [Edaphochlamys debaryana]|eukprot:KAG2498315.1 hypothetical protein HYH03_003576 [Edaphochlamys debaryana]